MVNDSKALAKSHSAQKLSTPKRAKKVASLQNLKVFKEDLARDNRDLEKPVSRLDHVNPEQSVDSVPE